MAYVAIPYVHEMAPPRTEIRLQSAQWISGSRIRVQFNGVAGKLSASGKPAGFLLCNKRTGLDEHWIFKIEFDSARPNIVLLRANAAVPRDQMQLCYATGSAPFGNVRDANGMPLPAFGPVAIGP